MPRGGFRPGAGRKRKDLAMAVVDGTRPSRLIVAKIPEGEGAQLTDENTPTIRECADYLKDAQKDEQPFMAEKYYNDICEWLRARRCMHLFDDQYLQRYAMLGARYAQIERLISRLGFMAKQPDGSARANPLESIAIDRLKQLNAMAAFIINEVRQNCSEPYTGFPNFADPMEAILAGKNV